MHSKGISGNEHIAKKLSLKTVQLSLQFLDSVGGNRIIGKYNL